MLWKAYKIKAVAQLSICAIAFYVLILLWIQWVQSSLFLFQSIRHNKCCSCYHHSQSDQIHYGETFMQKNKGQKCSDKRCNSIVCTCFCSTKRLLRPDIGEDAQSISDKAQHHRRQDIFYVGQLYGEWKSKSITGRDFMRKMGLSANTFYRRVREYEATHGIAEPTSA